MNHRERVLAAVNHRAVDRVPMDLGSCNVTSIHKNTYQRLLKHFDLEDHEIRLMDFATQLVIPCEALLNRLQIDTRGVLLSGAKVNKTQLLSENEYIDTWGVRWKRPENATCFDVVDSPLEAMESLEEVEAYRFPSREELASDMGVAERAAFLRGHTDFALVGSFGSSIFMKAQQLRGYSKLFEDMLIDKEIAHYLMQRILDLRIQLVDMLIDACGDKLDVIEMADDVAGQDSLLMSAELYREMIKPYTAALIAHIKSRCSAKILYHSCGSIFPLIEDLIEIGVDILNPIQVSAKNMGDLEGLKDRFGGRLCFWGGIDSQTLLPVAPPDAVREAVLDTVAHLGKGGGYVLCASHNLQNDIPVENISAMYEQAGIVRG